MEERGSERDLKMSCLDRRLRNEDSLTSQPGVGKFPLSPSWEAVPKSSYLIGLAPCRWTAGLSVELCRVQSKQFCVVHIQVLADVDHSHNKDKQPQTLLRAEPPRCRIVRPKQVHLTSKMRLRDDQVPSQIAG